MAIEVNSNERRSKPRKANTKMTNMHIADPSMIGINFLLLPCYKIFSTILIRSPLCVNDENIHNCNAEHCNVR